MTCEIKQITSAAPGWNALFLGDHEVGFADSCWCEPIAAWALCGVEDEQGVAEWVFPMILNKDGFCTLEVLDFESSDQFVCILRPGETPQMEHIRARIAEAMKQRGFPSFSSNLVTS